MRNSTAILPDHHPQRIGFAGTPEFAQDILVALVASGLRPELVLTAPDRPKGRGRKLRPTPVREFAASRGIPVLTPTSLNSPERVQEVAKYALDLLVVVAYGLILPPAILNLPRLGCLNVHPSLLPRWRGAAPIERAIMAGDTRTGVCLMRMDEGLDTGPIFDSASLPIQEGCTGDELRQALAELGVKRLLKVLVNLSNLQPQAQAREGITYANKIRSADQQIDWSLDAHLVARHIHALNSSAPTYSCATPSAETLKVRFLKVDARPNPRGGTPGEVLESPAGRIYIACGTGCVSILEASVLRGAGRRLSARELTNGFPTVFRLGSIFIC